MSIRRTENSRTAGLAGVGASGPGLATIAAGLERAGYEFTGRRMTRPPAGYPADHPRADLLRRSAFAQLGPRPESPFYDEELATQFTDYDPDRANQILDDAGFAERDDKGIRRRLDGKPIQFLIDVGVPSLNEAWIPATELVRKYWLEVGVDARIKSEDRSLFFERVFNNQHDAASYLGEFGDNDALLWPDAFVPTRIFALYGVGWGMSYSSDGADGVEPPAAVRRQLELFDDVEATVDDAERAELFRQVIAIARDQFYAIGTSLPLPYYGVVKNTFHNVPDVLPGTILESPAFARPEQFFTTQ